MNSYSTSINSQYGQSNLIGKIIKALEGAGKNLEALNLGDLALFDELHSGGKDATRALANLAGLQPGMNALDVGCGVGGPARTLASEYGCQVVGVDLTDDFVEAATMLTDKVHLSDRVTFRKGSALDLPFEDESFDVVWSQNTFMNIEDKKAAIREAVRVLRPNGILAIQITMAGKKDGLEYPVFWANNPEINFLTTPEEFHRLMTQEGLIELKWEDATARVVEGSRKQQANPPEERPILGPDVIIENAPVKRKNTIRGFEEGQIVDIYAVYRRTPC
jgi:SAM-dependent methyltransferase